MPRGPKKFSYTYRDLSRLLGVSEDTVRQDAHRGHLNEDDGLPGLMSYLGHRGLFEMGRLLGDDNGQSDDPDSDD